MPRGKERSPPGGKVAQKLHPILFLEGKGVHFALNEGGGTLRQSLLFCEKKGGKVLIDHSLSLESLSGEKGREVSPLEQKNELIRALSPGKKEGGSLL